MSAFERIREFSRWCLEAASTRSEQSRFGTAYFNDDFPLRYSANLLLADRIAPATPQELTAELDRLLGDHVHRKAILSEEEGARLAAGMHELGFVSDRTVSMELRGEPDRDPQLDLVDEIDHASRRSFLRGIYQREEWGRAPGVTEQLSEFSGWLEQTIGARFFAQRIDGKIAGTCELYVHAGVAQVETVDTLEEFRGRGVARNVVLRAAEAGRAAGADLVFIEADANDWPQELYRRLGFVQVGSYRELLRAPSGAPPVGSEPA